MSRRSIPELSLKDPYFWASAMAIFGLLALIMELGQSGSVSLIGSLLFGIGVVALVIRDYRRRLAAFHARRRE